MKNNKILIAGAVVILVLGGLLLFTNKKSTSPTDQTPSKDSGTMESSKDSITNLLARAGSSKCEYSYVPAGGNASSGTVYISDGKMNGEFQTEVSGKPTTMYMVNDGTYIYTWGTDMPEGVKMKNPTIDTNQPIPNESNKYIDPTQQYDFKCSPWIADTSKFTPPTNITFRDLSAMMQTTDDKTGTMKQSQCGACATLSGDAQAQCKKALGCE